MIDSVHFHVQVVDGPIPESTLRQPAGAGAMLQFRGVVRPQEDGRMIRGLNYQTYDPMAQKQLERLATKAVAQFDLISIHLVHSRGFVGAGFCSMWIALAAVRRKACLAAMDWLIDQIKADVPIWKSAVFADAPQAGQP